MIMPTTRIEAVAQALALEAVPRIWAAFITLLLNTTQLHATMHLADEIVLLDDGELHLVNHIPIITIRLVLAV